MSQIIFKQVHYTVGGLVEDIRLGKIGLPDIQRPFVWKNAKVRDLFDSMYRGYPVGYLLFWQNGLVPSNRTIGDGPKDLDPGLVIVDGQQRLTSLYAVIAGAQIIRSNYQSERIRIAFNPLSEIFEVTSAAIERDRWFIPDISDLLSGQANVFQIADEYLNGISSVRDLSEQERKTVQNSISNLQQISGFPFTALELNSTISEEDVADVFVRINSKGENLNQADFILTLMSVFWDEGRADLEQFCRQAKTPQANGTSAYNHFIDPYPVQLLRVTVGLAFRRARLQHVYSILRGKDMESGAFSDERRDEQFEALRQAQAKVLNLQYWHDFMQCLRQAGYRGRQMISSENAVLYCYTLYLIGRTEFHVDEHALRSSIAQWFFMSAVTSRYTGSFETTMESDLAMLRGAKSAQDFVDRLRRACGISLTSDFWQVQLPNVLAGSGARTPSRFAYEAALVLLEAPALFSDFKVVEMLDPSIGGPRRPMERHHLFPQGHLATRGITEARDRNQIANYTYVEWQDNVKISDQSPEEYLPQHRKRFNLTELAQMYRFHALPDGWENMGYGLFLERRRELMAQVIRAGYERLTSGPAGSQESDGIDLAELVASGESDTVEFKSTLRINLHTGKSDRNIEQSALKTLAGFLNTKGGTLVVGVADNGNPLGLESDGFENEDRMELHLTNIVNERMGHSAWLTMHTNFDDYADPDSSDEDEVRVMVIKCEPSHTPVYLKDSNGERFYVRTGPATAELSISQANDYIKQRFMG